MTYGQSQAGISITLVYKLPLQSVILGLGRGLKAKIFCLGLGLEAQAQDPGLANQDLGLGLALCDLANITASMGETTMQKNKRNNRNVILHIPDYN